MSASIPENYLDLFQKKAFGSFTTLMPDGSPQTTPVWVDYADGKVLVNSALGRQKDKNLRRDPRVAITADKLIDKLAKKYLDKDKYPFAQPGEQRVIYKIDPVHVSPHG